MSSYRTYKGAQLDLSVYQGKSTVDYPIEVLDDSGADFNLSVYSSILFKVYYRKHGELITSLTITSSSNIIYLDALKSATSALQTRSYWYECYGVLISPVNEEELITFGFLTND